MARFELTGCWALTEPSNGSDASDLKCTATKVPGGWLLDGQKRWIGNGTFADVTVVWARNSESGQVGGSTSRAFWMVQPAFWSFVTSSSLSLHYNE